MSHDCHMILSVYIQQLNMKRRYVQLSPYRIMGWISTQSTYCSRMQGFPWRLGRIMEHLLSLTTIAELGLQTRL